MINRLHNGQLSPDLGRKRLSNVSPYDYSVLQLFMILRCCSLLDITLTDHLRCAALPYFMFTHLPDPPTIKFPPQDLTVKMGSSDPRSMTCVVVGDYNHSELNPWTYNGDRVSFHGVTVEGPLFEPDLVVYRLTFQNVTDEKVFGNYTCLASASNFSIAALREDTSGELVLCYECECGCCM